MLNKQLIIGCLLAWLIMVVHSYRLRMGSRSLLPYKLDLSLSNVSETEKIICHKRMFIFPYDIYEYATQGSSNPLAKSFIFLRLSYQQISGNMIDDEIDVIGEQEQLFVKLPEVILVQGSSNEYLQILRHDESLMNKNFVIKNSTFQKYKAKDGKYSLNFYSLQVHRYMYAAIKIANRQLYQEIRQNQELHEAENATNVSSIPMTKEERRAFILNSIPIMDQMAASSDLTNHLAHLVMKRQIVENTKWGVRYNSFGMIYGSATILEEDANKQQILDLELVVLLSREGSSKRVQHFKQPLHLMKLTSISHLKICFQQQNYKLLLADSHSFYLLDFTQQLLHLDEYKTFNEELKNVFMVGRHCRVVTLQQIDENTILTEWKDYLSKRKIQRNGDMFGSYPICNEYFAICWTSQQCNLFNYKLAQIAVLNVNLSEQNLEWYLRIKVEELSLNTEIEVIGTNGSAAIIGLIKQEPIFKGNNSTDADKIKNSTIFWNFIYGLDIYMNRSEFKTAEMSRVIWDHLEWLQQGNKQPQSPNRHWEWLHHRRIQPLLSTYRQFAEQMQQNGVNCYTSLKTHSQILFTSGSTSNWSICSIEAETQSSSDLTLFFNGAKHNYDLYSCQAQVQSSSGDIAAECQLLIKSETKIDSNAKVYRIKGNRSFKLFLIRQQFTVEATLPTMLFRDIEKSEIQYASSMAVLIITTLSISLFILILFVVMKPLLISISVYYGWMNQRDDVPYPLSWLNLKIKLKRLIDYGYLKYVVHTNRDQEDETHCCFCLQTVISGKIAAQLFCMHEFHKECFNQWIKNEPNPRCPTCRREFTRSSFLDFQNSQQQIALNNQ